MRFQTALTGTLATVATGLFAWACFALNQTPPPGALTVDGYPRTFLARVGLDLTNPPQVHLTWEGPDAADQEIGPFPASPGCGMGSNDCNNPVESNCAGSLCTPKGTHVVEQVMDSLKSVPTCRFATVIDGRRGIAMHSHHDVPPYPASEGCVRLDSYAAQLIHDNCIVGKTVVEVYGEWSLPNAVEMVASEKETR